MSGAREDTVGGGAWPSLPLDAWKATHDTLHMWTQVVGKVRLERAAPQPHWWHVALYVTSRGLTTSPIPDGARTFQVDFDFVDHELRIDTSDGGRAGFALEPMSVAAFHRRTMDALRAVGVEVEIWTTPVEVERRVPFERDEELASYDADAANRFWRVLVQADRVMRRFHGEFLGKSSPVHFFWGSFDMAVTRFSGRRAPVHPGSPNVARSVMVEGYSHELQSAGFWPGAGLGEPAFYAYAYPEPDGFREASVGPDGAYYNETTGGYVLPYEAVRRSADPDAAVLEFLRSAYDAAARGGAWGPELVRAPSP